MAGKKNVKVDKSEDDAEGLTDDNEDDEEWLTDDKTKNEESTEKTDDVDDELETESENVADDEESSESSDDEGSVEDETEETSDDDFEVVKETLTKKTSEGKSFDLIPSNIFPELSLLTDSKTNSVLIGRKKSLYEKYGIQGALNIGKVKEQAYNSKDILLDSLNPHTIFVCGAKGSGKSYCLGVIAEELSKKNPEVATVVIDPVGVFWSMRYPNKEEKEVEKLAEWNLNPEGLDNIRVFVPKGVGETAPKETFDAVFSIKPSLLSANDWALTFEIERFSPTGLLLDKVLLKVQKGFTDAKGKKIKGKKDFSIEDLVFCLENDSDINSKERGFKTDSVRALSSRLEAAKSWGVFDVQGTPLIELCREGVMTVIDTSFLDDAVTALVVGILARRILSARKIATRQEASQRLGSETDVKDLLETDIPATWLFIDEAHTLIPSGNVKTPASSSLIEYVKQGRRPGCSLVFATQQPSAIDTQVLSQLDVILIHKLIFNDDIKAVIKRTPTIIPNHYKNPNFIKMLPIGIAMAGDRREETSRAFILEIRPRMSQHEGREAETIGSKRTLSNAQLITLAFSLLKSKLKRQGELSFAEIEKELKLLNEKYSSSASLKDILKVFGNFNYLINETEEKIVIEKLKPVKEDDFEEGTEEEGAEEPLSKQVIGDEEENESESEGQVKILMFKPRFYGKQILPLVNKFRKKSFLGLGSKEIVDSYGLKGLPVYRIEFNYFNERNAFKQGNLFIDSVSGEFLHLIDNKFVESNNVSLLYDASEDELKFLNALKHEALTRRQLAQKIIASKPALERMIKTLKEKKLIQEIKTQDEIKLRLVNKLDVPSSPLHSLMDSLKGVELVESEVMLKTKQNFSREAASKLVKTLWKKLVITKIEEIYWPVIETNFKLENGKTRTIYIDAIEGKELK